jgi:putative toxin-antitoxin system antitoxin component (TIGR02293 family)
MSKVNSAKKVITSANPLTGKALLQRVKEFAPLSKNEIAQECGYVQTTTSGVSRTDLTGFYDAVLAAKGVKLGGESGEDTARKEISQVNLHNTIEIETNLATKNITSTPLRYNTIEEIAERFQLDSNLRQQIFGISPRNQARLRKDNAILNPLVVDRFNRFNRITQQAINLFEDTDRALKWLRTPKNSLSGITPLASLSNDEGAKQVEEILYRVEYGIYG